MERVRKFADETIPVFTDLGKAAPAINRIFTQLPAFSNSSTLYFTSLGKFGQTAGPALKASEPLLERLEALGNSARPFASNLSSLFTNLRSTGGIERLMDFIFLTSGATNGYNSLGHFLRADIISGNCVALQGGSDTQACAGELLRVRNPPARRRASSLAIGLRGRTPQADAARCCARSKRIGRRAQRVQLREVRLAHLLGVGRIRAGPRDLARLSPAPQLPAGRMRGELMATTTPPRTPPPTAREQRGRPATPGRARPTRPPRWLIPAVIVIAIVVAAVLLMGGSSGAEYRLLFSSAELLVKGNQVQVGGVPVGVGDRNHPDAPEQGAREGPSRRLHRRRFIAARAQKSGSPRSPASPTATSRSRRGRTTSPRSPTAG